MTCRRTEVQCFASGDRSATMERLYLKAGSLPARAQPHQIIRPLPDVPPRTPRARPPSSNHYITSSPAGTHYLLRRLDRGREKEGRERKREKERGRERKREEGRGRKEEERGRARKSEEEGGRKRKRGGWHAGQRRGPHMTSARTQGHTPQAKPMRACASVSMHIRILCASTRACPCVCCLLSVPVSVSVSVAVAVPVSAFVSVAVSVSVAVPCACV